MTEPDAVERALQLARGELSASEATVERVWRRLPGAVPAAAPAAQGTWAALKATGAAGLVLAAALVGSGFGLGFWARDSVRAAQSASPAPPPLVAAAALPPPIVSVSSGPAAANETPPRPSPARTTLAPSPRPPARHAGVSRVAAEDAEQELALLARVERALRNDDAALALVLLDELEQRFPATRLGEERSAARLMSHCLQKQRGAGDAARTFLAAHPASVYRNRLRAVCGIENTREGESLTGSGSPDTDGR